MGSGSGNRHVERLDATKDWIGGASTHVLRIRTIASFFSASMAVQLALWLWKVMPPWAYGTLATFVVTSSGFLLFLRSVYLRSLRIQEGLRQFCHDVSAAVVDAEARKDPHALQSIYTAVTQGTLRVFERIRADGSMHVALRVPQLTENGKGFVTVARAGHYSSRRPVASELIPEDAGIPALLVKRGGGVYVLNDLAAARQEEGWHQTDNDNLADFRFAMVTSALSSYATGSSVKKTSLGVLSITSNAAAFSPGLDTTTLEICAAIARQALGAVIREQQSSERGDPGMRPKTLSGE